MSFAGGFTSSQASGDSPSRDRNREGVRPVMVHQLIEASQPTPEQTLVDGHELTNVSLVVCIRGIQSGTTNITLTGEDGTGQIDMRIWNDGSSTISEEQDLYKDKYVRVLGTVKSFSNKRYVNVSAYHLVTDHNEILYHHTDAVWSHLYLTRGPPGGAHAPQGAGVKADGGANPYTAQGGAANDGTSDEFAGLPKIQRMIMTEFKRLNETGELDNANGQHYEHFSRVLGIPADKILEQIGVLETDGSCYACMDDQHFLPCT